MRTGTPTLWGLADAFGVIPAPPDERLAGMFAGWWTVPRVFGCATAKEEQWWTVVAPDLRIWCTGCAGARFGDELRCVYCGEPVPRHGSPVLVYEMKGNVRVLARAHDGCTGMKGPR